MILVTGGAGYIGSHIVRQLTEADYTALVYDNLSTGKATALLHNEKIVIADLADNVQLETVFQEYTIDTVIHLAGSVSVEESVSNPIMYYQNNVTNLLNLLQLCVKHAVKKFIFSSSATVYAAQTLTALSEDSPTAPQNPYGYSKLMSEQLIKDTAKAHGLNFVILRYFNVAGAEPKTRIGQHSNVATHLIKKICQAALGKLEHLPIYGTDYPTADGTAIRDYIHVEDLAYTHICALNYLNQNNNSITLNVGYGQGYSVREVIATAKQVLGITFKTKEYNRRAGDPIMLVAQNDRILQHFDWQPQHNTLEKIITDAWGWEQKL